MLSAFVFDFVFCILRNVKYSTVKLSHIGSYVLLVHSDSRVPQLTCIWMSVGGRNAFTQSNLTLAASGAFKSSRTPPKIHF